MQLMSFGADGKRGRADSSKQGKTEQPKTKLSGCVTKTDRNQWPMARIVNIYIYSVNKSNSRSVRLLVSTTDK